MRKRYYPSPKTLAGVLLGLFLAALLGGAGPARKLLFFFLVLMAGSAGLALFQWSLYRSRVRCLERRIRKRGGRPLLMGVLLLLSWIFVTSLSPGLGGMLAILTAVWCTLGPTLALCCWRAGRGLLRSSGGEASALLAGLTVLGFLSWLPVAGWLAVLTVFLTCIGEEALDVGERLLEKAKTVSSDSPVAPSEALAPA